ncbi:hypothetical protein BDV98DRAFT_569251, partial [Pterulicium gracile]
MSTRAPTPTPGSIMVLPRSRPGTAGVRELPHGAQELHRPSGHLVVPVDLHPWYQSPSARGYRSELTLDGPFLDGLKPRRSRAPFSLRLMRMTRRPSIGQYDEKTEVDSILANVGPCSTWPRNASGSKVERTTEVGLKAGMLRKARSVMSLF